jgi:hypothetical protein
MTEIWDVTKALQKGINNTLHSADCIDDNECYCGAADDKKAMNEAIQYLKKYESVLLLADKLNWPEPIWREIYGLLDHRFNRADIPN